MAKMHAKLVLADLGNIRGLSIRYLSSFAKQNAIPTKLLFPVIESKGFGSLPRLTEMQKKLVVKFLNEEKATHFGCYLMTGHYRAFIELVQTIRKSGWKGYIIAGGVHPTVRPEESLFEGVNHAVVGPGEKSLIDIVHDKPLAEISGLVYRVNGGVKINEILPQASIDLDVLPFPDYDFEDHFVIRNMIIEPMTVPLYQKLSGWGGKYYYLTTTRGCPYRCAYCCNVNRFKLRRASVNKVMEELRYAKAKMPFLCGVNIQDDSFFMGSDQWVAEFCTKYKKEFGWPFIARIMGKFATFERLKMLKDAGLSYVSTGLQGSERMNREIYKRNETNESFLSAVHVMAQLNLSYIIDVILDVVYETEEDLREIARTLNKVARPFKVLAYGMTPFPGSDFYNRVVSDGLLEKFGADAYESMFTATRPNAYRTPLFWRRLIQNIIPIYKNRKVDNLIETGPHDGKAVLMANRLYLRAQLKMKMVEWLRQRNPRFFKLLLSFYGLVKRSFQNGN